MITDMITSIIELSTGAEFRIVELRLQMVCQLRMRSTITLECSKVGSRYDW